MRAEDVVLDEDLRPRFRMATPWGVADVHLALHGIQQVPNALAASAAALWCGSPFDGVVDALGCGRIAAAHGAAADPDGPVLLVDCYNANPASTEAALRSMAALPAGRKVALLGLMAELGSETGAEHQRVASWPRSSESMWSATRPRSTAPTQVAGTDDAVDLLLLALARAMQRS